MMIGYGELVKYGIPFNWRGMSFYFQPQFLKKNHFSNRHNSSSNDLNHFKPKLIPLNTPERTL